MISVGESASFLRFEGLGSSSAGNGDGATADVLCLLDFRFRFGVAASSDCPFGVSFFLTFKVFGRLGVTFGPSISMIESHCQVSFKMSELLALASSGKLTRVVADAIFGLFGGPVTHGGGRKGGKIMDRLGLVEGACR